MTNLEDQTTQQLESQETEWEPAEPEWVREDYGEYEEGAKERRARGAISPLPEGDSTWRVMPPIKGTRTPFFRAWTHQVNNEVVQEALDLLAGLPDVVRLGFAADLGVMEIVKSTLSQGFRSTYCFSKMRDEPCLDCVFAGILYKVSRAVPAIKKLAADLAKDLSSREEYFVGAVRMDLKEEMDRGPKILPLKESLYQLMNKIFLTPDLGGDFSHPMTGFNLIFAKVKDPKGAAFEIRGKKFPKMIYTVSAAHQHGPVKNMDWLKHLHDLSKVRDQPDEAAFRAQIEGDAAPARPADSLPEKQGAPAQRQIAAQGTATQPVDEDEWMQNPKDPGDWDTRANLRKRGIQV